MDKCSWRKYDRGGAGGPRNKNGTDFFFYRKKDVEKILRIKIHHSLIFLKKM